MSAQPAWWKSTEAMVAAILLLAMVLIGLVNPAFWSLENLFSLARSNIVIGIMALGVLLVMISGGIDVSFPAFAAAALVSPRMAAPTRPGSIRHCAGTSSGRSIRRSVRARTA